MGLLDQIQDKGVLNGLGSVAESFVPQALVNPQQGPGGIGGLFQALKDTGKDLYNFSPVGAGLGAVEGFSQGLTNGQLDPLERALMIGGAALGAGYAGRTMHRGIMAHGGYQEFGRNFLNDETGAIRLPGENDPALMSSVNLPRPVDAAPLPDLTQRPENMTRGRISGLNERTHRILGATTAEDMAQSVGRWGKADADKRVVAAGRVLTGLAQRVSEVDPHPLDPTGMYGASWELAGADYAWSRSLIDKDGLGSKFNELYGRFVTKPENLSLEESDQLSNMLGQIAVATKGINDPELVVSPLMRVAKVHLAEDGAAVHLEAPVWDPQGAYDKVERTRRLNQLNYRALYDQGVQNIHEVMRRATDDPELAAKLKYGPEWYPAGKALILERAPKFDIPDDKAIAAVSLTSAAQEWEGGGTENIDKGLRALRMAWDHPDSYEADGKTLASNKQLKGVLEDVKLAIGAGELTKGGALKKGMISLSDLKKLLLLKDTTPEKLFETIGRSDKQKSFYLNLKDPELHNPVTVDRHAFDIFFGADTGVDDRPLDVRPEPGITMRGTRPWDNDLTYNVIENAYRQVAEDLGVPANAVQAVAWEAWKAMKDEHGKAGWKRGDPFRLNDTGVSMLEGRTPLEGFLQEAANIPALAGSETDGQPAGLGKSLGLVRTGRGIAVVTHGAADDLSTANTVRVLHPSVLDHDVSGARLWVERRGIDRNDAGGFPGQDALPAKLWRDGVAPDGLTAPATVEIHNTLDRPHVVTVPGNHAVAHVPSGVVSDEVRKMLADEYGISPDKVQDYSGAEVQELIYKREILGADDIQAGDFKGLDSPLKTHVWSAISGELSEGPDGRIQELKDRGTDVGRWNNKAKHAAVGRELRSMGYKPIEVDGFYGGHEKSWLVVGMLPSEASKLGDKFFQDSIVTNYGLVYGKHSAHVGSYTPVEPSVLLDNGRYVPDRTTIHDGEFSTDAKSIAKAKKNYGKNDIYGDHVAFDPKAKDLYTEAELPDGKKKPKKIKFQVRLDFDNNDGMQPIDADALDEPFNEIGSKHGRAIAVSFPEDMPLPRLESMVGAMRAAGGERPVLYTHQPMGEGWTPVTEHHYNGPAGQLVIHRSRAIGDIAAQHRYGGWMPADDARWMGDTPVELNAAAPKNVFEQAPAKQADGSYIANGELRLKYGLPQGAEKPPTVTLQNKWWTSTIGGKEARYFVLDHPGGDLPNVGLGAAAEDARSALPATPTSVEGVLRKDLSIAELHVPLGPDGGPDLNALHNTLRMLKRYGAKLDVRRLKILGTDGQRYSITGEAA